MIIKRVDDLHNTIPSTFDSTLQNLSTHRKKLEILPRLLWKSRCTMAMMLQCITHYPETRNRFLKADMPTYFYPLMDINLTDKPLECLRLGALGVIAHMLKLIAVFIINKIMSTGEGLQYCCVLPDRFFFIDGLLKKLLVYLTAMGTPCPSLFNLLVGCYTNLSYKPRTRRGLRRYLPAMLFNGTFACLLAEDPAAERCRQQLIKTLEMK
ncbi:hypothetical protein IGI04_023644 [Brassica rapa subsp. trilocularis]|uniref:Rcd1-like protein n=1 Tax=Brassica rapa subsp. trilocularis TaxID=1813537 RepID=A0ABQ7M8M1_BRACM|nr:hypothetical protein IGI04_023644 [Brassica rapa subsp. trilocularis]